MCTSLAIKTEDFYFGRTMDLDYELNSAVIFTPRNYPFILRKTAQLTNHYAILGMGMEVDGYPLYADAVNEKGLCIAALNFPDNAYYPQEQTPNKINITPFEFIPWILGQCANLTEVRVLLSSTHLIDLPFRKDIPNTPLHWHIADKDSSIVLEHTRDGLGVFNNPVGVLTNNPAFGFQLTNLSQYLNLTYNYPQNCLTEAADIKPCGQGMGCVGLPGDFSPASRFVKAAYLSLNSVCDKDEESSMAQVFHLLDAVAVTKGSVLNREDQCNITTYSCCINADKGIYYYKTYANSQITAINLNRELLEDTQVKKFPLSTTQQIAWLN